MSELKRLILVRHGETANQSSIRYYGRTDVPLGPTGRVQVRAAARSLPGEVFEVVVASPLARAWESARIFAPDFPIHLEPDFREIDFGRWEGLTREEIEARDPVFFRQWQQHAEAFEFPGGERRAAFRERVQRGLERLLASGASSALVVAHKGPVRTIAERLTGSPLPRSEPALGGVVQVTRAPDGSWFVGRRSSSALHPSPVTPEQSAA
jgi:broad specificity phosphatase PhoE